MTAPPWYQGSGSSEDVQNHDNYHDEERNAASHSKRHYEQPHQSVGFWHSRMNKVRKDVMLLWLRTVLILMVFILGILSLYWAALFRVEENMHHLTVHIVDLDGQVSPYDSPALEAPFVGPTLTTVANRLRQSQDPRTLGYTVIPPSQYENDPFKARKAVADWDIWAAIIVHANASALLRTAAREGNNSYDPTGAVQYIVQTARQETTYYSYVIPQIDELLQEFGAEFGKRWAGELFSSSNSAYSNAGNAPAAVNPGVAPLQIDLRPFQPATATPATSIGLIYLIIISFFSFSFFLPIHMKYIQPHGHPPLHFYQLIIWRYISTIVAYLFISLAYSLVSLAFQVPFSTGPAPSPSVVGIGATAYAGQGPAFLLYWALNFVAMCALGLASENVAMVLGQPWTAMWLIFWVITNVSTGFYAMDLAPGFFQWGRAWPLHQVVQGSRMILFDMVRPSRLGRNFGVLVAWWAVDTLFFPFCCYVARWKTERVLRKKKEEEEESQDKPNRNGAEEKKPVKRRMKRGFMRGL